MANFRNGIFLPDKSVFNPFSYISDFSYDLLLVLLVELLTIAFVYVPALSGSLIRYPLGFLLLMFAPGYVVTAALFPRKSDLKGLERLVLSFTLSIAAVPMLGFVLNYTSWGVRLSPLLVSVILFTTVFTLLANKRRNSLPAEERFEVGLQQQVRELLAYVEPSGQGLAGKSLNLVFMLALLALLLSTAYLIVAPGSKDTFTELYILGPDNKTLDYPQSFYAGHGQPVWVDVISHEGGNTSYDLIIYLNNGTSRTPLGQELFSLGDGQQWEKIINLMPNEVGDHMKIEFDLFAGGDMSAPYRSAYLWVNVSQMGAQYTGLNVTDADGTPPDARIWDWFIATGENFNIAVLNHEYRTVHYNLEIALSNSTKRTVLFSDNRTLAHNGTWQLYPAITPDRTGRDMTLQFALYADNATAPCQSLNATISVYRVLANATPPYLPFEQIYDGSAG